MCFVKCIQVLLLPWWPSSLSLLSNSITSKTGKIRHALSAKGGEDSSGSRGGYTLSLPRHPFARRALPPVQPACLPALRSGWSVVSGRSELGWATSLGPTHSHTSARALKDTAGIFFNLEHLLFLSLDMFHGQCYLSIKVIVFINIKQMSAKWLNVNAIYWIFYFYIFI